MAKHELNILDSSGHGTIAWQQGDQNSTLTAASKFAEMLGKGYTAFRQGDGPKDGRITGFQEDATEIVMVPRTVGG